MMMQHKMTMILRVLVYDEAYTAHGGGSVEIDVESFVKLFGEGESKEKQVKI